jgi:hypothetical protein
MLDTPSSRAEVAVQLLGGLGNQMFQAAAGVALARQHQARLVFDISRFRAKGLRAFALAPFGLNAEIRTGRQGLVSRAKVALGLRPRHQPDWWQGRFYREPGFAYDPAFAILEPPVMIAGYFQSPRYFAHIGDEIVRLFSPEKLASAAALEQAQSLAGEHSVALHIRRGDYVHDRNATAVHGVLPENYYRDAIRLVREQVPEARFFIASDDLATATNLAALVHGAQVLRGQSAGDDLFLMSRCRHHVIANSSFSWWSAWLDRRPGGLRIAPHAWFTAEALKTRPIDDLIPADWVRL